MKPPSSPMTDVTGRTAGDVGTFSEAQHPGCRSQSVEVVLGELDGV